MRFNNDPESIQNEIDKMLALEHYESWQPLLIAVKAMVGNETVPPNVLQRIVEVLWQAREPLQQGQNPQHLAEEVVTQFEQPGMNVENDVYQAGGDINHNHIIIQLLRDSIGQIPVQNPRPETQVIDIVQPQIHTNLPDPPTILERTEDIERLKTRLLKPSVRLLTLIGPAGVGKSALAHDIAFSSQGVFKDGVFRIPLENIPSGNPERVLEKLAHTLPNFKECERRLLLSRLVDYLQDKQMLLLLDKFEHVLEAANDIKDLVESCPRIKFLVTSQHALGDVGNGLQEKYERIKPLKTPSVLSDDFRYQRLNHGSDIERLGDIASVKLLRHFADDIGYPTSSDPLRLTPENALAIAEICNWSSGLPGVLKVAVGEFIGTTPQQFWADLERVGLDAVSGDHLQHAIKSSYTLLRFDEDRSLFRRLSIFVGGCTREAITSVCKSSYENDPESLVNKRLRWLVQKNVVGFSEEKNRYRMPEPYRSFGIEEIRRRDSSAQRPGEQGNEEAKLRRAHAEYYADLVARLEPSFTTANRRQSLDTIEAEHDNIRAVMRWSRVTNELVVGPRLAANLFWFWNFQGHFAEGRLYLKEMLDRTACEGVNKIRAKLLHGNGGLAFLQGEYDEAKELLEESVAMWRTLFDQAEIDSRRSLGYSLTILAMAKKELGQFQDAMADATECVDIFKALNDKGALRDEFGLALALNDFANIVIQQPDELQASEQGWSCFNESVNIWRRIQDAWGLSLTLSNMGKFACLERDYQAASQYLLKSLQYQTNRKDRWGVAWTLAALGEAAIGRAVSSDNKQFYDDALLHYYCSLIIHRDLGRRQLMSECLSGLSTVASCLGYPEQAALLSGAADTYRTARTTRGLNSPDVGSGTEGTPIGNTGFGDLLPEANDQPHKIIETVKEFVEQRTGHPLQPDEHIKSLLLSHTPSV
jgi:predicted ATPase